MRQFPAGQGEPGEQATVRETLEETGLDVVAIETLGEHIHPATSCRMIHVAREALDYTAADELDAVKWCDHARTMEL
ncbi:MULTISPECIES: NUDIX hydrolase [Streptosporangium]|uniref:NUDIX hydrolase n=1 Tax=Streptosporangium TaxID=2000 RepID=UPI0035222CCA